GRQFSHHSDSTSDARQLDGLLGIIDHSSSSRELPRSTPITPGIPAAFQPSIGGGSGGGGGGGSGLPIYHALSEQQQQQQQDRLRSNFPPLSFIVPRSKLDRQQDAASGVSDDTTTSQVAGDDDEDLMMRAVLQKVLEASVTVDGKVVGQIGKGVCVLVGINQSDTKEDLEHVAKKILGLRVFEDESGGMWKKSVKDLGLEVLCVSQFTLYGKTTKGTKPDFHEAMKSSESKRFFDDFVQRLGELYDSSKISTGQFGAIMKVGIVNDGP
ncbi:D-tyrosyl-tRNA(Tyr) deacylase, partial [Dipsacomyces acuminosporus]